MVINMEKIKKMLLSDDSEMVRLGIKLANENLSKLKISVLFKEIQQTNQAKKFWLKNGLSKTSNAGRNIYVVGWCSN